MIHKKEGIVNKRDGVGGIELNRDESCEDLVTTLEQCY